MADERDLLRESARAILAADPALAARLDTLRGLTGDAELRPTLERVRARVGALESGPPDPALGLETIVNRVGRPVLEVENDDYVIGGPESAVWDDRLGKSAVRAALRAVIPSVGRIEVDRHPDLTWVGTGWLIADDVVVTNRHVAGEFAAPGSAAAAGAFVFKRGSPDRQTRMAARVDFRRELRNHAPRAFVVKEVLHIEDDDGPDFAFLRVERTGTDGGLTAHLRPAAVPAAGQYVATVGYPAADSRIPEQELMNRLFGDKYNVKRLAPGQVKGSANDLVTHDCSTLGGNSGSPIVDLNTGGVVGLHFSGVFLRENRGVPIGYVTSRLGQVLSRGRPTPDAPAPPVPISPPPPPPAQVGAGTTVTFTVPVQITVTVGTPAAAPPPPPAADPAAAVAEVRARLAGRKDVLAVRDGFLFRDGWVTTDPAVVVIHDGAADLGLPPTVLGVPVDIRAADPWEAVAAAGAAVDEGLPPTSYKPPADFALEEVDEEMTVVCHVSPDAGWATLRDFLGGTRTRLTVGMFDFTAPHVVDGVLAAVRDAPKTLALVMQAGESLGGKPDDIREVETLARYARELGERLDHVRASVGRGNQFASSYHIKVAVRDGEAVWLSSGNWQSSNQPAQAPAPGEASWELLRRYNREWHVVVENANLAGQFERFIRHDLEAARAAADREAPPTPAAAYLVDDAADERVAAGPPTYFAPLRVARRVRVRPLLTPDNYHAHVLPLIRSARRRVLFQNQSFGLLGPDRTGADGNDPRFNELVDALIDRQREGVDVRVIIRGEFAPAGPLEDLQRRGFDMTRLRLQNRCHTKGIIVDGRRVLIGSHNWTNQGTLANRDASLIFDDAEIAAYFEEVFWFDWWSLGRRRLGRRPRPVAAAEAVAPGAWVVPEAELLYGD